MVHIAAKFQENTSMPFFIYSAKTKRDRRTDRQGALQYLQSQGLRRGGR